SGDIGEIADLVRAAPADDAAPGTDTVRRGDILLVAGDHRRDTRLLQEQVDALGVQALLGGGRVQGAQDFAGRVYGLAVAEYAEAVAAAVDFHAETPLELAQVLVELPAQGR